MSGYLGARTQIADTGAYNREQADDLFPSKESVVAFSSTGTNTTMVKPPVYGIRVLEFTAATGTINLPDMSGQPGGGRFRILKNNATQGSVNINLSGTNVGIWGAVQLKLNADGDFWELQWTGSRFVLTDGHETGNNSNGEYVKFADGTQICTRKLNWDIDITSTSTSGVFGSGFESYDYPESFSSIDHASVSLSGGTPNRARNEVIGGKFNFGMTSTSMSASSWRNIRLFAEESVVFESGESLGVYLFAIGRWY